MWVAVVVAESVGPGGRVETSGEVGWGVLVVPGGLVRPWLWSQTNTSLTYGELGLLVRPGWRSRTYARVVGEGFRGERLGIPESEHTGVIAVLPAVTKGGCRDWGVSALCPLDLSGVSFNSGCVGLCDSAPAVVQCVAVRGGCRDYKRLRPLGGPLVVAECRGRVAG